MPRIISFEGRKVSVPDDATDAEVAEILDGQAGGFVAPEPPPGEIIHGAEGSYVAGNPALTVDTKGMSDAERNMAAAALASRRDAPMSKALMPAMQGVSMSWGDEAVSGLYGLAAGAQGGNVKDGYDFAQEMQRQELAQERKDHPVRSTVGQIAGALTTAPLLATRVASSGLATAPLATKMAAGLASGAGYGAIEGAGAGSGAGDRAAGAGVGAMVGGTLGAAAAGMGAAVKTGVSQFLDWRTTRQGLKSLGVDRTAGDIAMRALDADNAYAGSGARRLAQAGDDAMLADAGPAIRSVLDTAMQQGGPAMRIGGEAVEKRAAQQVTRLNNVLDGILGKPVGIATTKAKVRSAAQPILKDAYDVAYAKPIDYSSPDAIRLQELLKRVPAGAIKEANDYMGLVGHKSRQIMADVADDGTVSFKTLPDVLQVDHITRGLNALAEGSEGTGALGAQTAKGGAYERLSGEIRTLARKLVPEYGNALDSAADPIQEIKSLKFGKDLMRPSIARDEVALKVKGATGAELRGIRQGLRAQIDETLANVQAVVSDPNIDAREATKALRDLSSKAAREKMASVLGNPSAAAALGNELDKAAQALELRAGVSQNSRTFGRTVVNDAVRDAQEPGMIGAAMQGKPLNAVQRGVQGVFGTRPIDMVAQRDEIYRQVAELLTRPRGPETQAALKELYRAYQAIPKNAAIADKVGTGTSVAAGVAAIPQASALIKDMVMGRR